MKEFALAPYFHPTTICLLDDNEPFLASLDLELPGLWACRTFTDPLVALEYLQRPVELPPLMDRCFSMQRRSGATAVIELDLNLIEQEISHGDRFRRNSVVLVDYSMPSVNGLEFCAAPDDPYIRKAMLTGVADEKIAVQAFNAGLIHRFIPKHTANTISAIKGFVEELQREYFSQYTARLKTALAIDPPGFLIDTAVAAHVESLMRAGGLIEYYLADEPPGLMLLDRTGRIVRLAVLTPEELEGQVAFARAHGAPTHLVDRLATATAVGFFGGNRPEDYHGDERYPWADLLHPAETVRGAGSIWHVGVWRDAPADIDFDPATASYDAYLRSL